MSPERISIIGGGSMGAFMARLFNSAGLKADVFDAKDGPIPWAAAARAEVVLAAVPVSAMPEVAERLGPHTREDGAVIDIGSLKSGPVREMTRRCRGEIIGSHPLFGPGVGSIEGQTVFLCPSGPGPWLDWYRSFLENLGAVVVEIDPERHDRLMSRVQVLRHLLLLSFGRSLMRLEFDLHQDLPLSGPWFSNLVSLLGRQLEQAPDLYADLALENPEASPAFGEFLRSVEEVADSLRAGDRGQLLGLLGDVTDYLKGRSEAATGPGSTAG